MNPHLFASYCLIENYDLWLRSKKLNEFFFFLFGLPVLRKQFYFFFLLDFDMAVKNEVSVALSICRSCLLPSCDVVVYYASELCFWQNVLYWNYGSMLHE